MLINKHLNQKAQWKADTQTGENLHFELCKGGYFSNKEEYSLKVVGKTFQDNIPTPETPMPIQRIKEGSTVRVFGKNLFSIKNFEIESTRTQIMSDNYIFSPFNTQEQAHFYKENTQYTISLDFQFLSSQKTGSFGLRISYIGGSYQYFRFVTNGVPETKRSFTTAAGKTVNKITWSYSGAEITFLYFKNMQIEEGAIATAYEPYISGGEVVTPCDLYEHDIFFPSSGKVVKHNLMLTFDGTENWNDLGTYYEVSFDKLWPYFESQWKYTKCTHYESNGSPFKYGGCYLDNVSFSVNNIDTTGEKLPFFNSLEDFKAALAEWYSNGNPLRVICDLSSVCDFAYEQYDPQPIFAPQGVVNVLQEPTELAANLEATMLVRRT